MQVRAEAEVGELSPAACVAICRVDIDVTNDSLHKANQQPHLPQREPAHVSRSLLVV
jgi:hypothetical protein